MVFIDPLEEIRRLVEDEEIPRDEARARVREDLRRRQAVRTRSDGPKKPMNLRWTAKAAASGNLASRTAVRTRTPRKSKT